VYQIHKELQAKTCVELTAKTKEVEQTSNFTFLKRPVPMTSYSYH